jgi:hypothetical protein
MLCLLLIETTVLTAQVPHVDDIRGPRGYINIPVPAKSPIALWSGIAVGLLVVFIAGYFLRKMNRKQKAKSPSFIALTSLSELAGTGEKLAAETFANNAAKTVREYIASQFGIAAPRRTTEEFLNELAHNDTSPIVGQGDYLKSFLKSCDLAKFAGSYLNMKQREELLQTARGFVETSSAPVAKAKLEGVKS